MRDFVSCTTRCTVLPQRSYSENVARYGDMNKHPVETKCSLVIVLTNSRHSDSFIHSFIHSFSTHVSCPQVWTALVSFSKNFEMNSSLLAPERQICPSLIAAKADEQTLVWIDLVAWLCMLFCLIRVWLLACLFFCFFVYSQLSCQYLWRVDVQATRVMQELVQYYRRLANGSTIFCLDTNVSFSVCLDYDDGAMYAWATAFAMMIVMCFMEGSFAVSC